MDSKRELEWTGGEIEAARISRAQRGGMGDGISVVHQRVTRHHHLAVKGTDQHVRLRWSEREARGYETD